MNTPSRSQVLLPYFQYTAVLTIVSLLTWAMGLPGFLLQAQAAQLINLSDALSTTKPGTGADHTITFGTPSGVPADGSTFVVTLPAGFSFPFLDEDDVDIAVDGTDLTTASTCGTAQVGVSTSTQTIAFEVCTGGGGVIGAGSVVTIEIGQNATFDGTGSERIVNNATIGSYVLSIGGTMEDEGSTRIVIIDAVRVTGDVENYFDFQVSGVDAEESVNGEATLTTATTTATSVPFGLLIPNTEYTLGQTLSVTTNAANGFTVTVQADDDLTSSSGATIDSFTDGTGVAVPEVWDSPSAVSGSTDTYGHWGVTTEDVSLSDDDSFGSALYVGNFVNAPREVMFATSSADGTTAHIGQTRIGYKIEISTLQEAATDYTARIVYVATPIF